MKQRVNFFFIKITRLQNTTKYDRNIYKTSLHHLYEYKMLNKRTYNGDSTIYDELI